MADVTHVKPGRWGLARIIEPVAGDFTTAAMIERLAPNLDAYYPPLNATRTGYSLPYALVCSLDPVTVAPSAAVRLLPDLDIDRTLDDLTPSQRNRLRTDLEEWLQGYSYTDWRGLVQVVPPFSGARYTNATPIAQIIRDIYRHCAHSASTPEFPIVPESHNTEHTDDFTLDSTANYTAKAGTIAHDLVDGEIDVGMVNNWGFYYTGSAPGSIEHEAQCTYFSGNGATGPATGGAAVRFHTTEATDDWYYWRVDFTIDTLSLRRMNGGTVSAELASRSATLGDSNIFITLRMAAVGAAGNQVELSTWITDHGTTKPSSDPGWISATALTDYTDTAATGTRLDSSSHAKGGVGGHWQGADFDNRVDWFKVRAISDRPGAGGRTTKNTRAYPLGVDLGLNLWGPA